jgi:hypothetical protein
MADTRKGSEKRSLSDRDIVGESRGGDLRQQVKTLARLLAEAQRVCAAIQSQVGGGDSDAKGDADKAADTDKDAQDEKPADTDNDAKDEKPADTDADAKDEEAADADAADSKR